jgi:hypothetical protein
MDHAIIPREVINFREVNTGYDDYNSAGPMYFMRDDFSLVFSTNRYSNGNNFDLVAYHCQVYFNQVNASIEFFPDQLESPLFDTINSGFNEWGPFLTSDFTQQIYHGGSTDETARLFFSSDQTGNHDIYCWYFTADNNFTPKDSTGAISALRTSHEEGYLCLHQGISSGYETAYFTSNREGTFDIFKAEGEANLQIETSDSLKITKMEQLSGSSDDKCPYIVNNMMVFTSDREGGYGGFDLWYSVYNDGIWSDPENFGPGINTEYNEYRPIIIPTDPERFLNDMKIFSSDRPGGIGGYDLYYVGMKKRSGAASPGS